MGYTWEVSLLINFRSKSEASFEILGISGAFIHFSIFLNNFANFKTVKE